MFRDRDIEEIAAGMAHKAGYFYEPKCPSCGVVLGFGYHFPQHHCKEIPNGKTNTTETNAASGSGEIRSRSQDVSLGSPDEKRTDQ